MIIYTVNSNTSCALLSFVEMKHLHLLPNLSQNWYSVFHILYNCVIVIPTQMQDILCYANELTLVDLLLCLAWNGQIVTCTVHSQTSTPLCMPR